MSKKSSIIIFIVNCLLCIGVALCTVFCMSGWGTLIKVVCYGIAGVGLVFGAVTFFIKKFALFKTTFVVMVCAAVIVLCISLVSVFFNLNSYEDDEQKINALVNLIKGTGGWGMLVYFLIQILQVVVLPLPAVVCYVPGAMVWGAPIATAIASAGVLVGAVICYVIGKFFGYRAVVWIAGKETTDKYTKFLAKRGKVLFVMMQILPFFPDDILCMIVGLTGMNFWFFLATMVLVRPAIVAVYCFLGDGNLIPFDQPWGIAVWVIIIAVCVILAVLSFKYQDRIEKWLVEKFGRRKKKERAADGSIAADESVTEQGAEVTEQKDEKETKPGETQEKPPDKESGETQEKPPDKEADEKQDKEQNVIPN